MVVDVFGCIKVVVVVSGCVMVLVDALRCGCGSCGDGCSGNDEGGGDGGGCRLSSSSSWFVPYM